MKKEIKQQEEELSKKTYTYDNNGEIMFIKNVKVESLPKGDTFEMKVAWKKLPHSVKGIYSFDPKTK
jgi:hypothetical protein